MATPKERSDQRERARATRNAEEESLESSQEPERTPQQQADGQPENARELEDPSGGAGLTTRKERD
jgi:hypothetical protein